MLQIHQEMNFEKRKNTAKNNLIKMLSIIIIIDLIVNNNNGKHDEPNAKILITSSRLWTDVNAVKPKMRFQVYHNRAPINDGKREKYLSEKNTPQKYDMVLW